MKGAVSLLGFVFEGAFKLGFMKDKLLDQEYKHFAKSVFVKLEEEAKEDDTSIQIIKQVSQDPSYRIDNPPSSLRGLSRLLREATDPGEESGAIRKEWKEIYIKLLFAIGYSGGYFYGRKHTAFPKKYLIGEESDEIIWQNSDLLFVESQVLHILDLKLGGAMVALRRLLSEKSPRLPLSVYGVPVNVSTGELVFYRFLEQIMYIKDKLRESEDIFPENKGMLQMLCYATDFLANESEPIRQVSLELIYPLAEPLNLRFTVQKREILKRFLEDVRELYRSLKAKSLPYEEINSNSPHRHKRVREQTRITISALREEMQKRQEQSFSLPTGDITEARRDVRQRLEAFFLHPAPCKAIALLHSAGSGKTSTTRNLILQKPGKHIVIYMATRISLLDREYQHLAQQQAEHSDREIELVYKTANTVQADYADHKGTFWELKNHYAQGKLAATVQEIYDTINNREVDFIWAFVTLQSIVKTGREHKTSKHLKKLLRPSCKDYHIHIILDEFLGHKNGLFAIVELLDFLKEAQKHNRKASLYLFDANAFSPNLLEKLIEEYREFQVIPESLVLVPYEEERKISVEGIPFEIYAKHGYPAKELIIHKRFIEVEEEKDIPARVAEYIKSTLPKEESTAFLFLQNKEIIIETSKYLERIDFSTLIATATSKKSQKKINEGKEDVILGTSSVSRGLDFSRPHKPVNNIYIVVQNWGIENSLVETLQAVSRSRGDSKTESLPKSLHLLYLINRQYDVYRVENLTQMLDHADKNLVRIVYEKEVLRGFLDLDEVVTKILRQFLDKPSSNVLVPVPTQHTSRFTPNVIADFEDILSFLEDISKLAKQKELEELRKVLKESAYLYTTLPELDLLSSYNYYHPYILLDNYDIFLKFDNELRKKAIYLYNKVEQLLSEHNIDKAVKVKDFLESVLPIPKNTAPILLPVYSVVLAKNWLSEGERKDFLIHKRVGRGHAEVLGGSLKLKTYCANLNETEYACIPLGEDYPYREVLSGRFAKFPIQFVKSLLQ